MFVKDVDSITEKMIMPVDSFSSAQGLKPNSPVAFRPEERWERHKNFERIRFDMQVPLWRMRGDIDWVCQNSNGKWPLKVRESSQL